MRACVCQPRCSCGLDISCQWFFFSSRWALNFSSSGRLLQSRGEKLGRVSDSQWQFAADRQLHCEKVTFAVSVRTRRVTPWTMIFGCPYELSLSVILWMKAIRLIYCSLGCFAGLVTRPASFEIVNLLSVYDQFGMAGCSPRIAGFDISAVVCSCVLPLGCGGDFRKVPFVMSAAALVRMWLQGVH